jgi:hypothetical protein
VVCALQGLCDLPLFLRSTNKYQIDLVSHRDPICCTFKLHFSGRPHSIVKSLLLTHNTQHTHADREKNVQKQIHARKHSTHNTQHTTHNTQDTTHVHTTECDVCVYLCVCFCSGVCLRAVVHACVRACVDADVGVGMRVRSGSVHRSFAFSPGLPRHLLRVERA